MLAGLARLAPLSAFVAILSVAGCRPSSDGLASLASNHGGEAATEIHALLDQYTRALLRTDVATLDRIWADDLTFVDVHGELLGKQNRMDNIRSGATAFASIRLSEERIRAYGQAAVATFRAAIDAQYSGQEVSGDYRATTVWARPQGIWQMVAVQMTRMVP